MYERYTDPELSAEMRRLTSAIRHIEAKKAQELYTLKLQAHGARGVDRQKALTDMYNRHAEVEMQREQEAAPHRAALILVMEEIKRRGSSLW